MDVVILGLTPSTATTYWSGASGNEFLLLLTIDVILPAISSFPTIWTECAHTTYVAAMKTYNGSLTVNEFNFPEYSRKMHFCFDLQFLDTRMVHF